MGASYVDLTVAEPLTGMRYFGSKTSTLAQLTQLVANRVPQGSFCDCFGGIGTVGAHFKKLGYQVFTGDVMRFAYYFQVTRVQMDDLPDFDILLPNLGLRDANSLVSYLNQVPPVHGWLAREYAELRSFFTVENALRIQACWNTMRDWYRRDWISSAEWACLVASLIESVDRVANTAGTYYAHLKRFHRKALQPFMFEFIPIPRGARGGEAFWGDASSLVSQRPFDVLYLDPPYNQRVYARYYHLPETLARGDCPVVSGKSGVPEGPIMKSRFNSRAQAYTALKELLEGSDFRLLVFHYADDGLITPDELRTLFAAYRSVEERVLRTKGYSVGSDARVTNHRVYLVENA
jgi:adenine-specific DNA-methyltransferase